MGSPKEIKAALSAADEWTDPFYIEPGKFQVLIYGTGTAELTLRWTPYTAYDTTVGSHNVDPAAVGTEWYTYPRPSGKWEPGTYTVVPMDELGGWWVQVGIAAGETITGTVDVRVSQ